MGDLNPMIKMIIAPHFSNHCLHWVSNNDALFIYWKKNPIVFAQLIVQVSLPLSNLFKSPSPLFKIISSNCMVITSS